MVSNSLGISFIVCSMLAIVVAVAMLGASPSYGALSKRTPSNSEEGIEVYRNAPADDIINSDNSNSNNQSTATTMSGSDTCYDCFDCFALQRELWLQYRMLDFALTSMYAVKCSLFGVHCVPERQLIGCRRNMLSRFCAGLACDPSVFVRIARYMSHYYRSMTDLSYTCHLPFDDSDNACLRH